VGTYDDLITSEIVTLTAGLVGGDTLRAFAVGKTRAEFARAMVAHLEIKRAEIIAVGNGVTQYTAGGDSATRDLDQLGRAIDYFERISARARGGIVRQAVEFARDGGW
jgi:hypothetical protein